MPYRFLKFYTEMNIWIATNPDGKVNFFTEEPRRARTFSTEHEWEWVGNRIYVPKVDNLLDVFPLDYVPSWADAPLKADLHVNFPYER